MTEKTLGVLTLCFVLLAPAVSQAEGGAGAIDAFRQADHTIVSLLDHDNATQQLRQRTDALLDYRSLAIAALGGADRFASRCGSRCPEFANRLTKVIRLRHLEQVRTRQHGQTAYLGETVGKSVTVVKTRVTVAAGKTTRTQRIDYVMHKVQGAWQVRDIVTDGVSLGATYRAEFTTLADAEGIEAVLAELDVRLEEAVAAR